jgi:hypothetical protein
MVSKKRIIVVQGTEISVTSKNNNDYISLTDMLKPKMEISLLQISRGIEILWNFLVYEKVCITLILTMANSPQLKVNLD